MEEFEKEKILIGTVLIFPELINIINLHLEIDYARYIWNEISTNELKLDLLLKNLGSKYPVDYDQIKLFMYECIKKASHFIEIKVFVCDLISKYKNDNA